ncbi:MAG: hypothetical protein ACI9CO_000014 [Candidatus Azotimanducaceae bacterium]|jgi:hypothetical protein
MKSTKKVSCSSYGVSCLDNVLNDIALEIERRWKCFDYCYRIFPETVLGVTGEYGHFESLDIFDLLDHFSNYSKRSIQTISSFSDLQFKLYDNGIFFVELLIWTGSDTSIHDHGFTGVLYQLSGESIVSTYSFMEQNKVSQNITLGKLKLKDASYSSSGSYRVIPPGREEVHMVTHIDSPTISLIIRTHDIPELSPQLNYFPRNLMLSHSELDVLYRKKIRLVNILFEVDSGKARLALKDLTTGISTSELFWLLVKLSSFFFDPNNLELLKDIVCSSSEESERLTRESIVSTVAFMRSSSYLLNVVKPNITDNEDRKVISAIASSFSMNEKKLIFQKLGIGHSKDFDERIFKKLTEYEKTKYCASVMMLSGARAK